MKEIIKEKRKITGEHIRGLRSMVDFVEEEIDNDTAMEILEHLVRFDITIDNAFSKILKPKLSDRLFNGKKTSIGIGRK